jgi:hypothetical protein
VVHFYYHSVIPYFLRISCCGKGCVIVCTSMDSTCKFHGFFIEQEFAWFLFLTLQSLRNDLVASIMPV